MRLHEGVQRLEQVAATVEQQRRDWIQDWDRARADSEAQLYALDLATAALEQSTSVAAATVATANVARSALTAATATSAAAAAVTGGGPPNGFPALGRATPSLSTPSRHSRTSTAASAASLNPASATPDTHAPTNVDDGDSGTRRQHHHVYNQPSPGTLSSSLHSAGDALSPLGPDARLTRSSLRGRSMWAVLGAEAYNQRVTSGVPRFPPLPLS